LTDLSDLFFYFQSKSPRSPTNQKKISFKQAANLFFGPSGSSKRNADEAAEAAEKTPKKKQKTEPQMVSWLFFFCRKMENN
jgi:hypothetical protein